jgi:hypothetical protein
MGVHADKQRHAAAAVQGREIDSADVDESSSDSSSDACQKVEPEVAQAV